MSENSFSSPFEGYEIRDYLTNPNITAGRHTYYSGYYHERHFEENVRYLAPDRTDVDKLHIGSFCSIGSGVVFMMAGNQGHRFDWASTYPFHYMMDFSHASDAWEPRGDTVVGNDVWIGSEAMILPGVTLGDGAVIGARALVAHDVPSYAIVGGTPAKVLRYRFDDEEIALLLQLKWWDKDDGSIRRNLDLLCSKDIHRLVREWR